MNTKSFGESRVGQICASETAKSTLLVACLLLVSIFFGSLHAQVAVVIQPVLFSVGNPPVAGSVSISPNPASSNIYIYGAEGVVFEGLKIYDSSMNLVFTGTYSENVTWSVTLAEATYYFVVETDDGTETETVVIQE